MNELMQREVDYRIIYISEREFAERVNDVYISKQTAKRPPFFNELLEELVDIEAAFFVMQNREVFNDLNDDEVDELLNLVVAEDPNAIQKVFERIDPHFIELFARDLYLHLMVTGLTFFERDFYITHSVREYHSPLQSVW